MARITPERNILMADGRHLGADSPVRISDLPELLPLFQTPSWPFMSGGGGRRGAQGPAGPPGPGVANNVASANSLFAEATLSDTTPTNPQMVYNGSVVSQVSIPQGQQLVITDCYFGLGFVYWTIEVDSGAGFATLATFGFVITLPPVTEEKKFKSPIVIQGGPSVVMRLKVTAAATPATPIEVNATIRSYSRSA